ncbi:MAG: diadenylate cyclase CdaA [Chloroflexi bacterium]|nr:diadenylate cyclase CdaA [Chloroflexota bacterium]
MQIVQDAVTAVSRLSFWSMLDILIVAIIIFGVLLLFRGTSAVSVLYGIVLLLVAVLVVSSIPELVVLNWVLGNSLPILSIAILILFQPELRRAMERIGRFGIWINRPLGSPPTPGMSKTVEEICRAAKRLAERRYGALIVLERETGLQEYAETGVLIDGVVTAELLLTLFYPNSPLHDGAVIVRGERVVSAASVLPLSENLVDYQLGTRHRAAIGITERTDAISVVISEETGTISLANNGRMVRHLDEGRLRKVLTVLYRSTPYESLLKWPRRKLEFREKTSKAR